MLVQASNFAYKFEKCFLKVIPLDNLTRSNFINQKLLLRVETAERKTDKKLENITKRILQL
jgi:hypothetical protein